jgi:hypothetical protein
MWVRSMDCLEYADVLLFDTFKPPHDFIKMPHQVWAELRLESLGLGVHEPLLGFRGVFCLILGHSGQMVQGSGFRV